ncbi:MAG: hypothetical protein R3264_14195, partial [Anaerolineae bacterium]|nr:hypothetical protein [Anaerolineae bacterium]
MMPQTVGQTLVKRLLNYAYLQRHFINKNNFYERPISIGQQGDKHETEIELIFHWLCPNDLFGRLRRD